MNPITTLDASVAVILCDTRPERVSHRDRPMRGGGAVPGRTGRPPVALRIDQTADYNPVRIPSAEPAGAWHRPCSYVPAHREEREGL